MATFCGALGNGSFEEPSSPDTTSAAPEQVPSQAAPIQPVQNPIAQLLKGRTKKKQRSSAALQAAIARARRARPSS